MRTNGLSKLDGPFFFGWYMIENVDSHKDSVLFGVGWITYVWVLAISIWGGIVSYLGKRRKFSWASLVAQLSSSSFAGLMTAFACQYAGISCPLMGVLCGVAAHMGTPALIELAMKFKPVKALLEDKVGQ